MRLSFFLLQAVAPASGWDAIVLELFKALFVPFLLALYAYWCKKRDEKVQDHKKSEEEVRQVALATRQAEIAAMSGNTDAAIKAYQDILERVTEELRETKERLRECEEELRACEDEK